MTLTFTQRNTSDLKNGGVDAETLVSTRFQNCKN
jgi:hypothetical protein